MDRWLQLMDRWGVKIEEYLRYMDDGRVFLHPLKKGWRWEGDELCWKKEWEEEDKDKSSEMVTKAALSGSMQGVLSFLRFTTEVGEEFAEGWLPTLDVSLKVDGNGKVGWKFYEKPTTSETTVQCRSAMGATTKAQILANDMVRRLLNTGEGLPNTEIEKVVDGYAVKVLKSGHKREKVKES